MRITLDKPSLLGYEQALVVLSVTIFRGGNNAHHQSAYPH